MKKVYMLSVMVFATMMVVIGQPTTFYSGATMTAANGFTVTNSRLALADRGAYLQAIFQSTAVQPASTWAFHIGTQATPDYNNNWRPYVAGSTAITNNAIAAPNGGGNFGALFNSGGGGQDGNLPALAAAYYTFNLAENGAADSYMAMWETSYAPSQLTGGAHTAVQGNVNSGTSLSAAAGEGLMMRYSSDGFVSSTILKCNTNSNTSTTYFLPGFSSSSINATYYFYSTSRTKAAIDGDVTIHGQRAHDLSSFYLINNAGANYTTGALNLPVSATGTTDGNGTLYYVNLGAAFAAINNGVHTGAVTISVLADVTESVPAVLNASGTTVGTSPASSYTSVTVNPTGGAARTVSGAIVAGSPMIDLNGADNVTINGLNSGGNSLTISNTTVSTTSGTSTIRFIGGATGNIITNCSILGSFNATTITTNGGNIFFSTDAVTVNGNDNNTISNNNIGPAGANLPVKAIHGNGSTTTTAIGNSGIIIDNNNIFDFFHPAAASSGIYTNSGCNTWTISNNRLYQTATRTWTTGATHRAIDINNTTATQGAQGFTITGNTVGYASNTQTGVYTMTGSTGKFQGIVFNGISAGTISNINNNTVASVSLTGVTSSGTGTGSPMIGLLVINGSTITNGNTIGSQSATGSLVLSTTTTSSTDVYGIYNFSLDNWVANNNNIGGISVTNAGASGTFLVYGMRANTGTSLTWGASQNNIGGTVANSIQLSATGISSQVVGMQTPNAISTLALNTIRNLTTNIGTGTTTTASVAGIIFTSTTPVQTVRQNTIFNLNNTNATAASVVTGIQFTGGTGNIVERNLIYDLQVATNSATAEVNGIRVAGGTTTYRNNMIRLGNGISNAIGAVAANSSTTGINGFNGALGTDNFWHNSIYIEGSPTAGTGASYAFNGTQTTNTRSFRDNIFFNARSNAGATGSHYAVKLNGTVPNPTGLTINNNLYFVNGTGGVFGFFNSANVANIAAWRTAVGQDLGSFESNPQYNAPGAATPDLHLHPTNPTVAEGNGVDLGVVDDFDGQTRASFTPVDIGADAGNYVGIDLAPPSISYTAFGFTCNTGDRVLTATITDVTGVPTSGILQPRIYYRKNAGTWFSSQGVLASGTGNNGTWDFTIIAADMGGLVVGDNVQYYVIAQDGASPVNITSNPAAGLVATDVNTVTTAPTTPNTYNINSTLSGTYTVGATGNYTSLAAAFTAYSTSCLSGPVVFNLIDPSYISATPDTLRANPFASSVNTLTIRPVAPGTTISYNAPAAGIVLLDADYIRIDGSSAAASASACLIGGNSAIRDLTITNTNTGTSTAVLSVATGTGGAKNNIIKNLNIVGQDPTTTLLGISIGGNTPGTAGADNDSNRIENCSVKRAIFGIYSAGASLANMNVNTVITQNELDSTSATDRIRRVGIVMFNDSIGQVTYNRITGINTNESADAIGIAMGNQGIDNSITTSGGIVGALVANNKINGVASLSATGFSAAGITVSGGATGANTIRNNMITGVIAPATSPDLVAGIYVVGATGSNTRLYFNSVSLTGDRGTVVSQTPSFGIAITGTDPSVDLRNNILYTTQTSGGGANAQSYAIGMVSTAFTNLNSNYNAFWSTGANDGGFRTGSLGGGAGTNYAALAGWQAAVSDDANSLEVDPGFVNPLNDLHINPVVCTFKGLGTPITGINDDYDCNGRNALTPDIGADEFNPAATVTTTVAGSVSPGAIVEQAVRYTVSGTTDYLYTCDRIITTITPAGASPVTGNITTGVRIDTGSTKLGTPRLFGPRIYAIEPVVNPGTSTALVTLYYLQSEFDNFNLKALDSNYYELPGAGNGFNTDSLRVVQYHGTPTGGYLPGNYTGASEEWGTFNGATVVFDPAGNNGGGWWEVTIPVTSFSGFFLSAKPRPPLPIKVEYFRGTKQGNAHAFDWKVVPVNTNNGTIYLERSGDGRNFSSIYSVTASSVRMQQPFNYSTTNLLAGANHYRLRMVDDNGIVTYSQVVVLLNAVKGFEIVNIAPNPVTEGRFKLNITSAEQKRMDIMITDLSGRVVAKQTINIISGFNAIDMNVSKLASGTYQLSGITSEGRTRVLQFVKQ